jgi:hypothetical protein
MGTQSKFLLTVDTTGAVAKVQRLSDDGSLTDVPVSVFFSQLIVPSSTFSGSGSLVVTADPAPSDDPGKQPPAPFVRQPPPPDKQPPAPPRPTPKPPKTGADDT